MATYEIALSVTSEELKAFEDEFKSTRLGIVAYDTLSNAALPMFVAGYRAAKKKVVPVPEVETGAFYTMDQMRDYAQAMVTTRGFVVIEDLQNKVEEYRKCAQHARDTGDSVSFDIFSHVLGELRTVVDNAKTLGAKPFQKRAAYWAKKCFGEFQATDTRERNQRFAEEALELVQACGMTKREAVGAVNYVYGRPLGEKRQEVGGTYTTLALLCQAHGIDMVGEGERDLLEIDNAETTERIRTKRMGKPDFGEVEQITEEKLIEILKAIPGSYGFMLHFDGKLSQNGKWVHDEVKKLC